MAVKHKVVECVEAQPETRLSVILRALQSINNENSMHDNDHVKICERIVYGLGTVVRPTKTEDYVNFMADIKSVKEILVQACSNDTVVFATLRALYNAISDPSTERQPTMSIVLQLIDVKLLPTAVKWILHSGYSLPNLEEALMTLCNWLSHWTWTPNLGPLVLYFMQGLEAEQQYDITEVTLTYIEQLFKLLILPDTRVSVGPVVLHMLLNMQAPREGFLKIKPHISMVLCSLHKENSESSRKYLEEIVSLCLTLIKNFRGEKEMYQDLLPILQSCSPTLNIKKLECKTWPDESSIAIPLYDNIGKVGLTNLGNTCYMNSVLQALFMTKLFCNNMLLQTGDSMPLLHKLKVLFALLQYSPRTSLPPNEILNLARPPGFQPGQQHDSSEFLGYLLDALHEQERCSGVQTQAGDDATVGAAAIGPTVVQHSFGGTAVTLSRCGNCNTQSEHTDHFRELQLSFPNNSSNQSVQKLLDYYLQPEKLSGDNQYHCDTCQGLTDGERVTRVVEPPARLILTLKHFRYDPASQERTKLLQHVKLDLFVDLNEIHYELYAAVVHAGSSLDSGHYYTYARDSENWYRFNDILVTKTTFEELCGVRPPATPYILFYRKQDCPDPVSLPQSALPSFLRDILLRDCSELDTERRRRPTKVYDIRNKRNDDPPPPGCGGGSFIDNHNGSRYIC